METRVELTELPTGLAHEMEKLLRVAEDLQDKRDITSVRIERLRLLEMPLALISSAAAYGLLIASSILSDLSSIFIIIFSMSLGMLTSLYLEWRVLPPLKRRLRSDQRALVNIVELIRETEGYAADMADLSPLDRAQFRIRLSRFEIG